MNILTPSIYLARRTYRYFHIKRVFRSLDSIFFFLILKKMNSHLLFWNNYRFIGNCKTSTEYSLHPVSPKILKLENKIKTRKLILVQHICVGLWNFIPDVHLGSCHCNWITEPSLAPELSPLSGGAAVLQCKWSVDA